jgi:hypothetical protein
MKLSTLRSVVLAAMLMLAGLVVTVFFFVAYYDHQHCVRITGGLLSSYALNHTGKYPFHTNGFGDAILLLLQESNERQARFFSAPGDNAALLRDCLKTGKDVPEERCSRAYVQGLGETNNPAIAVVFDRYPTRGGDHRRRPWGPPMREVCLVGGDIDFILETDWPAFRAKQVELLVAEGISRSEAEKLYAPFKR